MKRVLSMILVVVMILTMSTFPVFADRSDTDELLEAPSEKFISLYTSLFEGEDTFELYDSEGNCITDWFIDQYLEAYQMGDFKVLWDVVADNAYALSYGEETVEVNTIVTNGVNVAEKTVYSNWVYRLENLDQLLRNKRVEFAYRIQCHYMYNESTGAITSYSTPWLELSMTYPGDLFPYTVSKTNQSYLVSTTKVKFVLSFSISFTYVGGSVAYQVLGPYTPSKEATATTTS